VLPTTVFPEQSCFQLSVCVPGLALNFELIEHLGLPLLIWWVDTLTYLSRE
jgi:hypothetical protein